MIARNMAFMPTKPDILVTAEDAKLYKPHIRMFKYAYDKAGISSHRLVHVAAGFHHDIEAAHAQGIRRIRINRRAEAGNAAFGPYDELSDLSGVPHLLGMELVSTWAAASSGPPYVQLSRPRDVVAGGGLGSCVLDGDEPPNSSS